MVTSWPPSSMALMSRPRRAISRLASAARLSPPVSSACIRAREAAVSAVSAPAKNAAAARPPTMMRKASGIFMRASLEVWGGRIHCAPFSSPSITVTRPNLHLSSCSPWHWLARLLPTCVCAGTLPAPVGMEAKRKPRIRHSSSLRGPGRQRKSWRLNPSSRRRNCARRKSLEPNSLFHQRAPTGCRPDDDITHDGDLVTLRLVAKVAPNDIRNPGDSNGGNNKVALRSYGGCLTGSAIEAKTGNTLRIFLLDSLDLA